MTDDHESTTAVEIVRDIERAQSSIDIPSIESNTDIWAMLDMGIDLEPEIEDRIHGYGWETTTRSLMTVISAAEGAAEVSIYSEGPNLEHVTVVIRHPNFEATGTGPYLRIAAANAVLAYTDHVQEMVNDLFGQYFPGVPARQ